MAANMDNPVNNGNPNATLATVNVNSSALTNSVILDKVFGYLTINEVKDARTVCKLWDLIGTACLGRRCSLSINKFMQFCEDDAKTGSRLSYSINHQLVRKVKIDNSLVDNGLDVGKKVDYDFLTFVIKYHKQIEEIQFNVNRHFAPTIKWVLENVHFPKLKTIQLFEKPHGETSIAGYGLDSFDFLNFLPMSNLTMLKISAPEDMKGRDGGTRVDEKDGFPYYQIIQEIINKSPNLDKLVIVENLYPDLSCCMKLKTLEFKAYLFKPFQLSGDNDVEIEIRQDFDLSKLLKMLHQVKNTLENLVMMIDIKYYKANIIDRLGIPEISSPEMDVKCPCFQSLKSLWIFPIEAFVLGFEEGTKNLFPSLKQLRLVDLCRGSSFLGEIILGLKTCWTNVEYLALDGLRFDDPSIFINKIVKTFPNTKSFSLSIKGDLETEPALQRFKYALSAIALADWNVEHLNIYIEFRCTVSKLIDALGEVVSLDGFKKLKNLKLSSMLPQLLSDDECISFEKIFTVLRSITFLRIKFKGSTLINMAKFIERHNLNIQFLDVD